MSELRTREGAADAHRHWFGTEKLTPSHVALRTGGRQVSLSAQSISSGGDCACPPLLVHCLTGGRK